MEFLKFSCDMMHKVEHLSLLFLLFYCKLHTKLCCCHGFHYLWNIGPHRKCVCVLHWIQCRLMRKSIDENVSVPDWPSTPVSLQRFLQTFHRCFIHFLHTIWINSSHFFLITLLHVFLNILIKAPFCWGTCLFITIHQVWTTEITLNVSSWMLLIYYCVWT